MAKLPSFQFYPGDWMKDFCLRRCSIFARGLLVDLLCLMFEAPVRGVLCEEDGETPLSNEEIVDLIQGGSQEEKLAALEELEAKRALSRDANGCLYCRRMVRDEKIRRERESAGSKGGSKSQAKRQANDQANPQANSKAKRGSSSSSSPSGNYQETNVSCCSEPEDRSEPTEYAFPVVGGKQPTWILTRRDYDRYHETFPGLDLDSELRLAVRWCETNPAKRKTPRGMLRFLTAWLERAQNNGHRREPIGTVPVKIDLDFPLE